MTRWTFPIFAGILLSVLYVQYFGTRAFVEVDIQVHRTTWFKIYWAEEGKNYSEKNMARVRVRPEQEHYRFFLTNLRGKERLRIDPHEYEGPAVVRKLVISQAGMDPIRFASPDDFGRLAPLDDVYVTDHDGQGFVVFSSGGDPRFEFVLDGKGEFPYGRELVRIAGIFLGVLLFFALTENCREERRFIPVLFAAVFVLVIVMAGISAPKVHPDEYVHLDAAAYYKSNWLPPVVEDPAIRHSYSVYGVSRLNNREISYLLTGKLAELLAPFKLPEYLGLRVFNLTLFGLMLLTVLRFPQTQLLAIPFLLSPQFWYVFSYCNSDAFALFLTFVVGCQVVLPNSQFNTFLTGPKNAAWLGRALLFGLLCALLLLLKKNYFIFILFLLIYFFWKHYFVRPGWDGKEVVRRMAVVVLIALVFAGLRVGTDYWVNGLDRDAKIARLRSELAAPLFNPETPLAEKHIFLYRKARGDSLKKLVVDERWFGKTFRSTFGVYGYHTIASTNAYYDFVRLAGISFLLFFFGAVLLRAPAAEKLLLFLFAGCAVGLTAISLWHSWTADFQPQGRYLFPIIPMLGMLVYHARRYVPDAGFRLFLLVIFVMGICSFIFTGLMFIPKAGMDSLLWQPLT
jgi:hypothetical protein